MPKAVNFVGRMSGSLFRKSRSALRGVAEHLDRRLITQQWNRLNRDQYQRTSVSPALYSRNDSRYGYQQINHQHLSYQGEIAALDSTDPNLPGLQERYIQFLFENVAPFSKFQKPFEGGVQRLRTPDQIWSKLLGAVIDFAKLDLKSGFNKVKPSNLFQTITLNSDNIFPYLGTSEIN